jgi:hypothetical protein
VKAQDAIVAIDGEATQGKSLYDVADLLQGDAGSSVTLRVQRKGEGSPKDIQLIRCGSSNCRSWILLRWMLGHKLGPYRLIRRCMHVQDMMLLWIQQLGVWCTSLRLLTCHVAFTRSCQAHALLRTSEGPEAMAGSVHMHSLLSLLHNCASRNA